jgi:hypothetical protein
VRSWLQSLNPGSWGWGRKGKREKERERERERERELGEIKTTIEKYFTI